MQSTITNSRWWKRALPSGRPRTLPAAVSGALTLRTLTLRTLALSTLTLSTLTLSAAALAAAGSGAVTSGTAANPVMSETDYYAEQPVVLSVSRLVQSQARAPAAVTVIDRAMIVASGFRTIPDLLRLVPGFQVAWVHGGSPTVTYQGLSSVYSRRMQVLVDGRSVYNPGYGHTRWQLLSVALEDVDRIEVVRGPNAANDGSNAVQATIHIFTAHAATERGAAVHLAAGENGVRDAVLRYAGGSDESRWRMTYRERREDRLDTRHYAPIDATHDRFFNFRLDQRISARDEATLEAGYNLGNWDNSAVGLSFSPTQTSDLASWYVQGRWQRRFDADNEWTLQFHHTQTRDDESFAAPGALTSPTDLNNRFQRDALEWSMNRRIHPDVRMTFGAEIRYESAASLAFLNSPKTVSGEVYRVSTAAEWAFAPDWLLHAATMLERNYYGGTRWSPRLALNWQAAPEHHLRLGAAQAWRTPTFLEQNADFALRQGATVVDQLLLSPFTLEPERMRSVELGYVWQSLPRGVALDARLFHNRLSAIIDATTPPLAVPGEVVGNGADLTYANVANARQTGLDYQLRWKYDPDGWVALWQSWVRTDADHPKYLNTTPSHNLGVLTARELGAGWRASAGYYRIGDLRWVGADEVTPAYDRLDLRLAKRWERAETAYELALTVQSADGKYSEYHGTRYFDPRAFVSLDLRF